MSQPSNVTTTVTNSKGSVVKTIDVEREAYPYGCYYSNAVTWDGTDEAGKVVPGGVYTLHIHVVDPFGQVGETTAELGVETQMPGTLTLPASGATLSGSAKWVFTPMAGFPVSGVHVTCGSGWSEVFLPEPDGAFASTLETTGCTNGENSITGYVEWMDPLGGGHSWSFTSVPVKVENAPQVTPPELWIDGGHQYFSPNGDGQEDTDTVSYCMSQTAKVSATVVDSHGTVVRTLASEEEVPEDAGCWDGSRWFTWDGTNDAGKVVPGGVYTVMIHAVNAAGLSA